MSHYFALQTVFICVSFQGYAAHDQICRLSCSDSPVNLSAQSGEVVNRGPPGPPGKSGPPGIPGRPAQDTRHKFYSSCLDIKNELHESADGIYSLRSPGGFDYQVYCDMTTNGGGWTLIATIHENNANASGKCTAGDRWSSEQGNTDQRLSGDGNWVNRNTFGHVGSATSDDYKNHAFFELQARDLMIWQTLDDTPVQNYNTSYLKYRTTNGFLSRYGGNLQKLFSQYYPLKAQTFSFPSDSGPSVPVVFDRGDAASLLALMPPNAQSHLQPGYIQFRAISVHQDVFALCPGVRNKPTFNYPSQSCLSSGKTRHNVYCGDFSGLLHDPYVAGQAWSASKKFLESTFMLFYR